jgi:hypothetical protein
MSCGLIAILALRPLFPRERSGTAVTKRSVTVSYAKTIGKLCSWRTIRAVDPIDFIGKVERGI